jgi:hypothetical protein
MRHVGAVVDEPLGERRFGHFHTELRDAHADCHQG